MMLLTDFINKYFLMKFLYIFMLILALSTFFHFLLLIIQKIRIEKREKKKKKLEKKYTEKIMEILYANKAEEIKIKTSLEAEALSNVLISFVSNYTGEIQHKALKIAYNSGVIDFYLKKCSSKNWLDRIDGFEKLAFFKLYEHKNFYINALKNENNSYVQLQIIYNLSLIADKEILLFLIEILSGTHIKISLSLKFIEQIFVNALKSILEKSKNEELLIVKSIENALLDDKINIDVKKSLIHSLGYANFNSAVNLLLSIFNKVSDDLKTAIIRALGRMGVPEVCQLINKSYMNNNWILRTVSAQYAYLCENAVEILTKNLCDSNYYVRRSAGLALLKLDPKLRNKIVELINESNDRYAKEMINLILKRISNYA
jgi:hypothetical protein